MAFGAVRLFPEICRRLACGDACEARVAGPRSGCRTGRNPDVPGSFRHVRDFSPDGGHARSPASGMKKQGAGLLPETVVSPRTKSEYTRTKSTQWAVWNHGRIS